MNSCIGIVRIAILAALYGAAPSAVASGFAIGTQSGSGTGNAFAGGAAAADDPSVVWSNPAGMSLLPAGKHATGALHILKPSFKYRDGGSTGAFAAPGTGNGADGGDWAYVPNGFFVMDLTPKLHFGLALNAPFGLKTDYDAGWRGQLTARKSDIKTVNINPSLAYKVTDTFSIGAGVSVQYFDAELSSFTGAAGGVFTLKADDVGYGYNFGAMFQVAPNLRVGAAYRSSIKFALDGTADFNGPAGPLLGSGARADLTVPENISLSFSTMLSPAWELMGDVTWTRWSRLQQLIVTRTSATGAGAAAGSTLTRLDFEWDDAWRFGLGANYKLNDRTKLRFGAAFDKTPTKDATRTPRLPDEDRTWVAVGVQYKLSKSGTVEVGYAHEFIRDANINTTQAPLTCPPHCLTGKFESKADILSLQYTHSF